MCISQQFRVSSLILGFVAIFAMSLVNADETPDGNEAREGAEARTEESPLASADRAIRFYQRRIEQHPKSVLSYIHLANHYVRKAKDFGDESCYALAQQSLEKALKLSPDDPQALLAISTVYCSRHQFRSGLEAAKRSFELDPSSLEALAVVADAQMELGEYDAAESTLNTIAGSVKSPAPGLWVRQAHLAEIRGQTDDAHQLLSQAEAEVLKGKNGEPIPPRLVWYQVRLGHFYLDHGRLEEAAQRMEAAVASQPGYFLARAGLADLRTAQGRYEEALAEYRRTIELVPDPIFFMAVGDIEARLGRIKEAQQQYEIAEKLIVESDGTPAEYSRELSQFYSDRNLKPERALELAKVDLTFRQDIHGHDALAWALYRNELFADAAASIEKALRWGTKDTKVHYHAGMIYAGLKRTEQAKAHLQQALKTNPEFSVLHAEEARKALDALTRSAPQEKH